MLLALSFFLPRSLRVLLYYRQTGQKGKIPPFWHFDNSINETGSLLIWFNRLEFIGRVKHEPKIATVIVLIKSLHHLWHSLNAVIILSQQMRQADDPAYGALLSRLRRRSPTDDDINILNSRIRTQVPTQNIPPVIVRRHSVRQAINHYCLEKIRNSQQSDLLQCVATVLERKKMRLEEVYSIMYPSVNSKADAILNLLPGIPLMITTNINIPLGKILPYLSIAC